MIEFGVSRDVWEFDPDGEEEAVIETVGSLIIYDDDDATGEPITSVTFYTLGLDRLRGALEAAAGGEPVDDILLALDAAALASDLMRPPDDDADPAA